MSTGCPRAKDPSVVQSIYFQIAWAGETKMINEWAIEFNLRIRHAGFEADFYHDNSDSLTPR